MLKVAQQWQHTADERTTHLQSLSLKSVVPEANMRTAQKDDISVLSSDDNE